MVNYWNLSDGDDIHKTGGEFETGGGNFAPIPCLLYTSPSPRD